MLIDTKYSAFDRHQVYLLPDEADDRFTVNQAYLMSLDSDDLLFNFRHEAVNTRGRMGHGGWEAPGCQLRGHFLGHWLSAAARIYATSGWLPIKRKADGIVAGLAECQGLNGNGWIGSFPEKYMRALELKRPVWAPHYTLHKTLMGLYEMHALADNVQALEVLEKAAAWFHAWAMAFSREAFDDILDCETGGMLEVWADLYGLTGKPEHKELMDRYYRARLFEPIRRGEDVFSLKHANTMIPEIYGAARAYEVTGDVKYREIVEHFWRAVVPSRMYATGSHSHNEEWSRPNQLADTLCGSNQEFCVVYNMMWLAKYLFRWTGDVAYLDYYERNFFNGIFSGHHPETGMFTYYHPFKFEIPYRGNHKNWLSRTNDFVCCYGTGVQSIAEIPNGIYFHGDGEVAVNLYVSSVLDFKVGPNPVSLEQCSDMPEGDTASFLLSCPDAVSFALSLHIPWWVGADAEITVNGEVQPGPVSPSSFYTLDRIWEDGDEIAVKFPRYLYTCPTPDNPDLMAVLYGPLVLSPLTEKTELSIATDSDRVEDWVVQTSQSPLRFELRAKDLTLPMIPMYEVAKEGFIVYMTVNAGERPGTRTAKTEDAARQGGAETARIVAGG